MEQSGIRWRLPKKWRPYAGRRLTEFMEQNTIRIPAVAKEAMVTEEHVRWCMNCAIYESEIRYLMYKAKIIKQRRDNSRQRNRSTSN